MRGWNPDINSDNHFMREKCILAQDFDLIGIAETHLLNDNELKLPGFVWYGHNRTNIHVRAKKKKKARVESGFSSERLYQTYMMLK